MLLTFKSIRGLIPGYLSEFLPRYKSDRPNLRSGEDNTLLAIPRTKKHHGDIGFTSAAPNLWNSLPINIRMSSYVAIFKKSLKTYLFPK